MHTKLLKCRGGMREVIEGQVVLQRNAVAAAMKLVLAVQARDTSHYEL